MQQEEYELPALAMAIPQVYREWQRRAKTSMAWQDYFLIPKTFAEAIQRAPLQVESCDRLTLLRSSTASLPYSRNVVCNLS